MFHSTSFEAIIVAAELVLAISGTLILLIRALRRRFRHRGLAIGIAVKANVIALRYEPFTDSNGEVRGEPGWRIVAQSEEDSHGEARVFTSQRLWMNPKSHFPLGSKIVVYELPERPFGYAIQLDRLPGGEHK